MYLAAWITADRPDAQAVLTVKVGPLVLYFTLRTPVGILVIKCSRLNRFIFWNLLLTDYWTYSDTLVVFEPITPMHIPTFDLSYLSRSS